MIPQGIPNAAPMGVASMSPEELTALLTDPRTPPGTRAAAMRALQMRSPARVMPTTGTPQSPAAMPPQSTPMGQQPADGMGVDVMGALQQGAAMADRMRGMAKGGAVRGYDDGGSVDDDSDTALAGLDDTDDSSLGMGGGSLGAMDPRFTRMVKTMLAGAQGAPTKEDKGLALAQMGFGMAASGSPHFGQAVGQGALVGLDALQKLRQQRAVQAMRAAALAEQAGYHGDLLKTREDIAKQTDLTRQAAVQQRAEAAAAAAQVRKDALAQAAQVHADQQSALQEQRYQANATARDRNFYATGMWRDLPGDQEHGITGKPSPEDRPALPQVMDPKTPPKVAQTLDQTHPQSYLALQSFVDDTDNALKKIAALENHPGLESGTGTEGQILKHIPLLSTDAKNFNIMKDSLVTDLKLGALAQMRALSKNGSSGLGRVTNTEFSTVGEKIANLDSAQNTDQMRSALADVRDAMQKAASHMRDAYTETYGGNYKGKPPPTLPWEADATTGAGGAGRIKVQKGSETLLIDPSDLDAAKKDGYMPVQ